MRRPIAEILIEPGREWTPKPAASEGSIAELLSTVDFELPEEYIEFLRYCNGGWGELDAPPLLFHLYSIAESLQLNEHWRAHDAFADFWFFGGNGGLESIAFDLRIGPPWPIVMIDCIAGDDSAERIAVDMADFVEKVGVPADELPA